MRHCGSANHPNKSVIGTPQCQILHHILRQSADTYHNNGVLYDTVGVLITVFELLIAAASTESVPHYDINELINKHVLETCFSTSF